MVVLYVFKISHLVIRFPYDIMCYSSAFYNTILFLEFYSRTPSPLTVFFYLGNDFKFTLFIYHYHNHYDHRHYYYYYYYRHHHHHHHRLR